MSDIGQKFTLGHYIGWNCLKKQKCLKKRKQSSLAQQLEFYLLFLQFFVYWWCSKGASTWSLLPYIWKFMPLSSMSWTGMTVSLAWATAASSCSACSIVEAWESLSAGSSSSSLSVVGDLRKYLVTDTWSANDRDRLKRWLVSNDVAPCRLFAVHSLCPLLSAPSPQLLAREVSVIVASVAAEWLCLQRFPVRAQYWKRLTHDQLWSW